MVRAVSSITKRYERKLIVPLDIRDNIIFLINSHPSRFKEIYETRQINNIYFDTSDYEYYSTNIIGNKDRTKVRIRWYGNMFGIASPILEFKKKYGNVGDKKTFKLKKIKINNATTKLDIKKIFAYEAIPKNIYSELKLLNISLVNSYSRRYFISLDKKFRITIDSDINYFRTPSKYLFKNINKCKDPNMILEIKYSTSDELFASDIINFFPFRISRNSKYVNGIVETCY